MKPFIKEILADAAILSGLIILPMAFLGPGWRSKDTDYDRNHGRVYEGPSSSTNGEPVSTQETSRSPTERGTTDRYIPILHAFPKEDTKDS